MTKTFYSRPDVARIIGCDPTAIYLAAKANALPPETLVIGRVPLWSRDILPEVIRQMALRRNRGNGLEPIDVGQVLARAGIELATA